MKKTFFYFVVEMLFLTTHIYAQYRLDRNWLVGYESYAGEGSGFGITQMQFDTDNMTLQWQDKPINFESTAFTITDPTDGEVMFTTNGLVILDKSNDTMQNGFGLSPCAYSDEWKDGGVSYSQGVLILPIFGQLGKYILFHEPLLVFGNYNFTYAPKLLYSIIDMSENNGLGAIVQKNIEILSDSLIEGQFTAVKHANGRDYWVIIPRITGNGYHKLLITPNGISSDSYQEIGTRSISRGGGGTVHFTPDGTKYLKFDNYLADRLTILDFDRCTGEFNMVYINSEKPWAAGGIAISPNSRFLYMGTDTLMYQMDLQSSDIWASRILIGTYDAICLPFKRH